jgi:glycosyltransferase A (GT-A) superfamily protein (DUF2064 family)
VTGPPAQALERALGSLAAAWARDAGAQVVAPGARLSDLVGAADRYPVIVAWPSLPRWRADVAEAVRDDLSGGCDLVLGPTMDAGLYLLALGRPLPGLVERFEAPLSDDAVVLGAQAAQEAGIEIGLLRVERGLVTAADARAALIDPLTPPEVVALLGD